MHAAHAAENETYSVAGAVLGFSRHKWCHENPLNTSYPLCVMITTPDIHCCAYHPVCLSVGRTWQKVGAVDALVMLAVTTIA